MGEPDSRTRRIRQVVAPAACAFAAATGLLTLTAASLDVATRSDHQLGRCFSFLLLLPSLAGTAISRIARQGLRAGRDRNRVLAWVAAGGLVFGVASAWLCREDPLATAGPAGLRSCTLSLFQAGPFLFLAVALALLVDRRPSMVAWAQIFALAAGLTAVVAGIACLEASRAGVACIPARDQLAACVIVFTLSAAALCARPDDGLMALLSAETTVGMVVRRMIPLAGGLSVAAGSWSLLVEPYVVLPRYTARALDLTLTLFPVLVLVCWMARTMHEQELARGLVVGALRFRAEHYRQIIDASPVAIVSGLAGRIDYANNAAQRLVGARAPWELLGRAPTDFVMPERKVQAERKWRETVVDQGAVLTGTCRIRRLDGRPIDVECTAVPQKARRGVQIFIRSVPAPEPSARGEDPVRAGACFQAVFEQATIGVVLVATDGYIVRANGRFCAMCGYSAQELRGRSFCDLTHPADLPADLAHKRQLLAGIVSSYTIEKRYVARGGRAVWCELTMALVPGAAGEPDHFIGLVAEVSRRHELEAQLIQAEKLNAIGQLAGGVAHDFNNILTVVQGHVTLMRLDSALSASALDSIEQIGKAARRATSLTRQLLLFSRHEVMQPVCVDLNENVDQMARMLQRLVGENVRIHLARHGSPLPVFADPGMLDQVLMNLAVNARDAMPHGGDLRIETAEVLLPAGELGDNGRVAPGRYARLVVSDTGCGIPPDVLPRIFETFFTTKEPGKGTGLGLATVLHIVKQHRGWVDAQSEQGHGATFRVFLPWCEQAPQDPEEETDVCPAADCSAGTVLFVEDDGALREVAVALLERYGYGVLACATAEEAMAVWGEARDDISVLVTDLMLPGPLSGRGLVEKLQKERPDLKIILASGYGGKPLGRPLGAREAFIQKPYDPSRLLGTIELLCRPS